MLNAEKMKQLWKQEQGKVEWLYVLTNGVVALLFYLLSTFLVAMLFGIYLVLSDKEEFTFSMFVLIDVIDIGLFVLCLQFFIKRILNKATTAPFKTSVWAGCVMWLGMIVIYRATGDDDVETYVRLMDGATNIIELILVNYLPYKMIMKGKIEQSSSTIE